MDYTVILKIGAIGILTAVVAQILKNIGKDEISTFVTLSGVIVAMLMVVNMISQLFSTVKQLFLIY